MAKRLVSWLLLDNLGTQSTCAGDAGDVAGLADQILHDSQNPELIPRILQSRDNAQSAVGLRTTATHPAHDFHGTEYPCPRKCLMMTACISQCYSVHVPTIQAMDVEPRTQGH